MAWLELILAGVAIMAAALIPAFVAARHVERRTYVLARDRAHSNMARLETEVAIAGHYSDRQPAAALAQRCWTIAGACLNGVDTTDAYRRAEMWSKRGLRLLDQQIRPAGTGDDGGLDDVEFDVDYEE